MSKSFPYSLLAIACMPSALAFSAQDVHLRAGTLLQCTVVEPNFSSQSAKIGEPLICHARPFREFGREAVPRGSYLTGQFAGFHDPGRLVGKGWMKLEFDRLILPNGDVPIATKVLSVGSFSVDGEGRIRGRGHPRRDALGWTIPLLWPVKLITLPQRGPRPTLKGEQPVMLRLLEDVVIPGDAFLSSSTATSTQQDGSNGLQAQSWDRFPKSRTVWHSFRRHEDRYRAFDRTRDRYRDP
jgi:hypothetical protein